MTFQMAPAEAPVAAVEVPAIRPPHHTLRRRRYGANQSWAPSPP
jgi:hypothetical protein